MRIRFSWAALVLLASCAMQPETPPPARVVTECSWIQPLTFSRADTPETKRQIIALADKIAVNCPQLQGTPFK